MSAPASHSDRGYARRATTYLHLHRGIQREEATSHPFGMVLLGLVLCAAWLAVLPWAGEGWVWILDLLRDPLGMSDRTAAVHYVIGGRTVLVLPEAIIDGPQPSTPTVILNAVALLVLLIVSFIISVEKAPLRYFLRLIVLLHGMSVVYHALPGRELPYDVGGYVSGLLAAGVTVIALVPVVLSLTHWLFDFGVARKLGLALGVMAYLYVLIPFKYALHAIILHVGGMIYLPILFVLFGLPIEVMIFIAFYGWGMSWKGRTQSN
jgi:hypothetical protein